MAFSKDRRYPLKLLFLLLLLGGFPGSFLGTTGHAASEPWPGRGELLDRFHQERKLLVVYGASDPRWADAYREVADRYRERSRYREIVVRSDLEVGESELAQHTVLLLGSLQSNTLIRRWSGTLPLGLTDSGFRFNDRDYRQPGDFFSLFYPNPGQTGRGVFWVCANSDSFLVAAIKSDMSLLTRPGGDLRIRRNGKSEVMAFFEDKAGAPWRIDPASLRDFSARRMTTTGGEAPLVFISHGAGFNPAAADSLQRRFGKLREQLAAILDIRDPFPPINCHFYASAEEKGLITGDTRPASADMSEMALHMVLSEELNGGDGSHLVYMLIQVAGQKSDRTLLQNGLCAALAVNWLDRGLDYWAQRLFQSGNLPALRDLLDETWFAQESHLVSNTAAGSFVAFLLQAKGSSFLREIFHGWQPTAQNVAVLESEWHAWLSDHAGAFPRPKPRAVPDYTHFQGGFCHAHEGYQIYNGYGSKASAAALLKLRQMHVNAVSLTPFSYMRDPNQPTPFGFSNRSGSETDESVIHDARYAHQLGMSVMIKPHIWMGRGMWPGDIRMTNPGDWDRFFDYYTRWIRHFAILAEMVDAEYLCLGVEMGITTLEAPEHWQRLIATIRPLFSGKLVYAANWGEEFEKLSFWGDLDLIGLNCYYPLNDKNNATDSDLAAGMADIAARIEKVSRRYDRPVMLTEIGFTSTPSPWIEPHQVAGDRPVDLAGQLRSYQAVFEGLTGKAWLAGMYWWKWPSYLEYGGPADNDFTPNGKPAQAVVARYFGKWTR